MKRRLKAWMFSWQNPKPIHRSQNMNSQFVSLPPEILDIICSFVPPKQIIKMESLCKDFKSKIDTTQFWKSQCIHRKLSLEHIKKVKPPKHIKNVFKFVLIKGLETRAKILEDTFIFFGERNKPAYSQDVLKAYQTQNRRVLMKFDLYPFTKVETAILYLFKFWDGKEHQWRGGRDEYRFRVIENNWKDVEVTWDTAPLPKYENEIYPLVKYIGKTYTWHYIDITPLINEALALNIKNKEKDWHIISIDFQGNDNASLSQFYALEHRK